MAPASGVPSRVPKEGATSPTCCTEERLPSEAYLPTHKRATTEGDKASSTGHAADQYWFVSPLHRVSIYEAIKRAGWCERSRLNRGAGNRMPAPLGAGRRRGRDNGNACAKSYDSTRPYQGRHLRLRRRQPREGVSARGCASLPLKHATYRRHR